ncbi:MAG: DUF488 family protein [Chroococcidiopsidaceae cyanobacterium CP_BM_RX_35]|nr:DUF488 family protein [Chroococcidiopsidaceae cyanobacterium CP_BM_RX_35]
MKTSYYATTNSDCGIAISKYPPAGWQGKVYPPLAPSTNLLNNFKNKRYTIEDYIRLYQQQLDKLDPQQVWAELHELAAGAEPVLLCYEKPKVRLATFGYEPLCNDSDLWFCHRRLVAIWLESTLGIAVPEALREKPGFKHLGYIRSNLDELKKWCRAQHLTEKPTVSNYARGRFEKWFEMEFKLTQAVEVVPAEHDERVYQLGQKLYPGNDCCLFLHYPAGIGILPHRDHTASTAWVISVNIGCPVIFRHGDDVYHLQDGQVVGFDSKIIHSLDPVPHERWALSWRCIKPEYLDRQLSLFQ